MEVWAHGKEEYPEDYLRFVSFRFTNLPIICLIVFDMM